VQLFTVASKSKSH